MVEKEDTFFNDDNHRRKDFLLNFFSMNFNLNLFR